MKRLITLFVALFICNIQLIWATDVTGIISTNTSWTLAGSPYIVTGNITINPGVTLTVDSSVVVKFNSSRNMSVNGTLSAKYANFTSSAASPTPGVWDYIQFGSTTYHGFGSLKNCNLYYGNQIYVMNGTVSMEGCVLDNFFSNGIQCSDTLNLKDTYINLPSYNATYGYAINALANGYINANNLDVGNCKIGFYVNTGSKLFTSNGSSIIGADQYGAYVLGQMNLTSTSIDLTGYTSIGHGIEATNGSLVTLDNSSITHSNYALHIYTGSSISISNCTFTTNVWPGYYEGTGSVTTSGTNNFTGNTRNAFYVNFSTLTTTWTLPTINVPYYFNNGDFIINQGATLSILSGNIIKIKRNNGIYINGALTANSDIGTNIYFTSERDDNWGGDTNNDGTTTAPATNDWYGITFNVSLR
jgi:hypothetical protein